MTGTSGRARAGTRQHFEAAHPRHVDVGEDEFELCVLRRADPLQSLGRGLRELHEEARRAQLLAELLAKKFGDVGLVVDDQDQRAHGPAPLRGRTMVNCAYEPGSVEDLERPAMLLDDNVVAKREAESSAFAGRLGGEERIEHFRLHLVRNAGAVVADGDLDIDRRGRASKRRSSVRKTPLPSLCLRFVVA